VISSSGEHLVVAGQAGKALEVYEVNEASGNLIKKSSIPTEGNANWVELRAP
jgi:6-phosphogluconolactonase (cycloisomerase 2 family)